MNGGDGSEIRYGTFQSLLEAGVPTALLAGGPHESEGLLAMACFAVRHGSARDKSLRAVTLTPAEILGVADRVGSIEPGKDADFVIVAPARHHWKNVPPGMEGMERSWFKNNNVLIEGSLKSYKVK